MVDKIGKEEDAFSLLTEDGFFVLNESDTGEETGITRSIFKPIFSDIIKEI